MRKYIEVASMLRWQREKYERLSTPSLSSFSLPSLSRKACDAVHLELTQDNILYNKSPGP